MYAPVPNLFQESPIAHPVGSFGNGHSARRLTQLDRCYPAEQVMLFPKPKRPLVQPGLGLVAELEIEGEDDAGEQKPHLVHGHADGNKVSKMGAVTEAGTAKGSTATHFWPRQLRWPQLKGCAASRTSPA